MRCEIEKTNRKDCASIFHEAYAISSLVFEITSYSHDPNLHVYTYGSLNRNPPLWGRSRR